MPELAAVSVKSTSTSQSSKLEQFLSSGCDKTRATRLQDFLHNHACCQDHFVCSSSWSGSRTAATLPSSATQYNSGQGCPARMLTTHVIVEETPDVLHCEIWHTGNKGWRQRWQNQKYRLTGGPMAYRRAWMPAGGRSVGEVVAGVVGPARRWREQCMLCTSGSSPHLPEQDTITVIPAPKRASCVVGLSLTDMTQWLGIHSCLVECQHLLAGACAEA